MLIVKEYQNEFFVRHALILDTFQKAEYSEIFEEAVSIAASFAFSIQTQESLLDLMFVGTEAYCFTSGRGLAHADRMLEILASVRACLDKPFSTLPPLVTERASLLSGSICILLSWDEERKRFQRIELPSHKPYFADIITDSRGRIWLNRFKSSGSRKGIKEIDIFSPQGKYIYRAKIPHFPKVLRNEYLYTTVYEPETEYRKIKRYKIKNWENIEEGIE